MSKIVVAGVVFFLVVVLAMPGLKGGGYSAARDSISEGALGGYGWLQTAAFVVLGLASLLLALLLRRELEGRQAAVAAVLAALWGVAILLCAVFPVDAGAKGETPAAKVHLAAALVAFVCVLGAIWFATFAMRGDDEWDGRFVLSLVVAVLATVGFVVTGAAPQEGSWGGLAQRAFTVVVLVWIAGFSLAAA